MKAAHLQSSFKRVTNFGCNSQWAAGLEVSLSFMLHTTDTHAHTHISPREMSRLLPRSSVHSTKLHVIPNPSRKTTQPEAVPKCERPGQTLRHVTVSKCVPTLRIVNVVCWICTFCYFARLSDFMTSRLTSLMLTLLLGCRIHKHTVEQRCVLLSCRFMFKHHSVSTVELL